MSYFKGPDLVAETNTSILTLLYDALTNDNGHAIVIEGDSGRRLSYVDILQQSQSIAAGLRSAGVTAGDYLVLCCDKSARAYTLLLAGMFTGATVVNVPPTHAGVLHQTTMGHAVKAVFCDEVYLDSATRSVSKMSPPPTLLATSDQEDRTVESLMDTDQGFSLYEVPDTEKHIPLIMFTSGTTGLPKGVLLSDYNLGQQAISTLPGHHSFMATSPFSWLSGVLLFIASVFRNYSFVMSNSTDPKHHLQIIEKYQVDLWFVMSGQMHRYNKEPSAQQFDLPSLRAVFTGGEPLLSTVVDSFSVNILPEDALMIVLYASTEIGKIARVRLNDLELAKGTVVSCGTVAAGVEVKILDDDGDLVEVGSLGQICVKSRSMTPGYWKPELNHHLYDKDGFFHTGDAGYFDKLGRLYVTGRVGALIDYKGAKFPPSELEDLLMSHPAVLEAAVVGRPHPADTNHATAYVTKVDQNSGTTETDLQSFVDGRVEEAKKLRGGVHFLEKIPRTASGKVARQQLLQRI